MKQLVIVFLSSIINSKINSNFNKINKTLGIKTNNQKDNHFYNHKDIKTNLLMNKTKYNLNRNSKTNNRINKEKK